MFEIGDRVKCINAEWSGNGLQSRLGVACPLQQGSIYTVIGFATYPGFGVDGVESKACKLLVLEEVKQPFSAPGFDVRRFRKLPCIEQGLEQLLALPQSTKSLELEGVSS